MNLSDSAGLTLSILSILVIYFAGMRWFIRSEISSVVRAIIQEIIEVEMQVVKHELTNNGGSSTKDKIDYIYKHIKGE